MATLNIRISDELNNSLLVYAKDMDRPKGYLVRKALEDYFRELRLQRQEDEEDLRIALARLNNPNRKWLTPEEASEKLRKKFNV